MNLSAIEQNLLEIEKIEILNLFASIQETVNTLKFISLKNNEASANFSQKHRMRLKNIECEIQNFANNDYLVAVVGRYSSGKSTLINALLGTDVLPYNIKETTSIITKIKYGKHQLVRILYRGGHDVKIPFDRKVLHEFLWYKGKDYSSDITEVQVFISAEELKNGITIIDTPGLGSVNNSNNQLANEMLSNCSAIIMTFQDVGGKENAEIVKKIFQWNFENYYTIIFVITGKDTLNESEEIDAKESILSLVEQAKIDLQRPDIKTPYICIVSSTNEQNYKLFKKGQIDISTLMENRKLHLRTSSDIDTLHAESGFDEFISILNKTVLNSNIRKEQIKNLLLGINNIVGGIHFDLNDYLNYFEKYMTIAELETALNEKIDSIREIEKQGNIAVLKLEERITQLSKLFKNEKLNDLNDKIFCDMSDYIDGESIDKLTSNKSKKLIQKFENIAISEMKIFCDKFNSELETNAKRLLEKLADIIQRATKKDLINLSVDFEESLIDLGDLKVRTNSFGKSVIISLTTVPTSALAGVTLGNCIIPVIGGIVGGVLFGGIGVAGNILLNNDKSSEKKKANIKESIKVFLSNQRSYNRQAITSIADQYIDYCCKIKKQLANILKEEKAKRDSLLVYFESEKKNISDNKNAIKNDLLTISPFLKELSLLIAKHTILD